MDPTTVNLVQNSLPAVVIVALTLTVMFLAGAYAMEVRARARLLAQNALELRRDREDVRVRRIVDLEESVAVLRKDLDAQVDRHIAELERSRGEVVQMAKDGIEANNRLAAGIERLVGFLNRHGPDGT